MRPAWFHWKSSHRGAPGKGGTSRRGRRIIQGGLASTLAVVGLVAFATPAFAHDNHVAATPACSSPLGSGYTITWTIDNDYYLSEEGSVTSVTGGLTTLNSTTYSIAASVGVPNSTTTLTQTLPASTSGTITIDISSTWSDGFSTTDTGSVSLDGLNCAGPTQTIAGHIYLCNGGNPTQTEETGGSLAAAGSGLTTVPSTDNPLAPTSVLAGTYTMTATTPPGYQLVSCSGSSTPNGPGTSATESVNVPSGGAGVGIFYVTSIQTIAGHIYLCNAGTQSTTEVPGGSLAAAGSGLTTVPSTDNPLAPTSVLAGTYTMTATTPPGYQLASCSGSSTPNGPGTSATESVNVPSGGAGVGIFYVTSIQTIAGHIYLCNAGTQSTTEVPGGSLAAAGSGLTTVPSTDNPLAPTSVLAGTYTMTATTPPGYQLVSCSGSSTPNGPGTSATESVNVPSGGAGVGIFYVTSIQTIAGHIYLCNAGTQSTTEVPGGSLAAAGSGLTTVPSTDNPLAPTSVLAGTYTMTATTPPGYQLASCSGSSTPNGPGTSATESVNVPSGGAGVGIFYVVQSKPAISIVKTASTPTVSTVGQTVTYTFTVSNTGNVPLSNVDVTDAQAAPSLGSSLGPITCTTGTNGSISLAVGAGDTCSATYTVTQADLTNGSVADTATASGYPPGSQTPVTDSASVTLTVTVAPITTAAATTPTAPGATTTPIAIPPTTLPSTTAALAFTGALLSQEWMVGITSLLLGIALVVTRWRRRNPHEAAK